MIPVISIKKKKKKKKKEKEKVDLYSQQIYLHTYVY